MLQLLRQLLLLLIVKPITGLLIGVDVIGKEKLPLKGPALVAANHNSHVDTLILLSLFPASKLKLVRPVAAADHFLTTPFSSWFSRSIVGIIPIRRKGAGRGEDVLAEAKAALHRGQILVIFPEGTRGKPEEMAKFKNGIARLAQEFPEASTTPIYIQGAGRTLPRGARLFVPFNCTAVIGDPLHFEGDRADYMHKLREAVEHLKEQAPPLHWT